MLCVAAVNVDDMSSAASVLSKQLSATLVSMSRTAFPMVLVMREASRALLWPRALAIPLPVLFGSPEATRPPGDSIPGEACFTQPCESTGGDTIMVGTGSVDQPQVLARVDPEIAVRLQLESAESFCSPSHERSLQLTADSDIAFYSYASRILSVLRDEGARWGLGLQAAEAGAPLRQMFDRLSKVPSLPSSTSDALTRKDFKPTYEWQRVLPWQILPTGLEIRLPIDGQSDKKRARIPPAWQLQLYVRRDKEDRGGFFVRTYVTASTTIRDLRRAVVSRPQLADVSVDAVKFSLDGNMLQDEDTAASLDLFNRVGKLEVQVARIRVDDGSNTSPERE